MSITPISKQILSCLLALSLGFSPVLATKKASADPVSSFFLGTIAIMQGAGIYQRHKGLKEISADAAALRESLRFLNSHIAHMGGHLKDINGSIQDVREEIERLRSATLLVNGVIQLPSDKTLEKETADRIVSEIFQGKSTTALSLSLTQADILVILAASDLRKYVEKSSVFSRMSRTAAKELEKAGFSVSDKMKSNGPAMGFLEAIAMIKVVSKAFKDNGIEWKNDPASTAIKESGRANPVFEAVPVFLKTILIGAYKGVVESADASRLVLINGRGSREIVDISSPRLIPNLEEFVLKRGVVLEIQKEIEILLLSSVSGLDPQSKELLERELSLNSLTATKKLVRKLYSVQESLSSIKSEHRPLSMKSPDIEKIQRDYDIKSYDAKQTLMQILLGGGATIVLASFTGIFTIYGFGPIITIGTGTLFSLAIVSAAERVLKIRLERHEAVNAAKSRYKEEIVRAKLRNSQEYDRANQLLERLNKVLVELSERKKIGRCVSRLMK